MSKQKNNGDDKQLSGAPLPSADFKINKKADVLHGTRKLLTDRDEQMGFTPSDYQSGVLTEGSELKSNVTTSSYGANYRKFDERLIKDYLITPEQMETGYKGNYDELYNAAARRQGAWGRIGAATWNLIPGIAGKTVQQAGSILGTVGSFLYPPAYWNEETAAKLNYENWVMKAGEWIEENGSYKVYNSEEYRNARTLRQKAGTSDFIATDFAEGVEFLVSGLLLGAGAGKVIGGAGKVAQMARFGTGVMVSTMGEAGMEAAETYKNIKQKLRSVQGTKDKHGNIINYSEEEMKEKARDAATLVYRTNMGVLGVSNAMSHAFLLHPSLFKMGSKNAVNKALMRQLKGAEDLSKLNKAQKTLRKARQIGGAAGRTIGKGGVMMGSSTVSEGLWEENAQLAASRLAERLALGEENWEGTLDYIGELGAQMTDHAYAFMKGMSKFGNARLSGHDMEAATSILLGGLLGGGSGIVGHINTEFKGGEYADEINQILGEAKIAQGMFMGDMASVIEMEEVDGKMVPKTDANGNFSINQEAAEKIMQQNMYDNKLMEEMMTAMENNDPYHAAMIREMALSRMAQRLAVVEQQRQSRSWFGMGKNTAKGMGLALFNEQAKMMSEQLEQLGLESDGTLADRAQEYMNMWNQAKESISTSDINRGITSSRFEDLYSKVNYFNQVKLKALEKQRQLAVDQNKTELAQALENQITDTQNYLANLRNNKKAASDRWESSINFGKKKTKRLQAINTELKDVGISPESRKALEKEKEELIYEIQEKRGIFGSLDTEGLPVETPMGNSLVEVERGNKDYFDTELAITEHESIRSGAVRGEKDLYHYRKGQGMVAATAVKHARDRYDEAKAVYEEATKKGDPKEVEAAIKEVEAVKAELMDLFDKNAISSPTGIEDHIDEVALDTAGELSNAERSLESIETTIKELEQTIKDLEASLASMSKDSVPATQLLKGIEMLARMSVEFGQAIGPEYENIMRTLMDGTDTDAIPQAIGQLVLAIEEAASTKKGKKLVNKVIGKASGGKFNPKGPDTAAGFVYNALQNSLMNQAAKDMEEQITSAKQDLQGLKEDAKFTEDQIQKYQNEISEIQRIWAKAETALAPERALWKAKTPYYFWQRTYAEKPIQSVLNLMSLANARPEAFDDSRAVTAARGKLEKIKRIFEDRKAEFHSGKLIEQPEFDGFMDGINQALWYLDYLADLAQQNAGKRDVKQQQVREETARRDMAILGIEQDPDNPSSYLVADSTIWDSIVEVVGQDVIDEMMADANDIEDLGTIARITLQKFKNQAELGQKGKLKGLAQKARYTIKKWAANRKNTKKYGLENLAKELHYWKNPRRNTKSIFRKYMKLADALYQDDPQYNPFFIFEEDRDLIGLESNIESSKLSDEQKEEMKELIKIHKRFINLMTLSASISSEFNYAEQFISENDILNKIAQDGTEMGKKHVPTAEQLTAIREIVNYLKNIENVDLEHAYSQVASYLRGIPGTGKTKMVLKWVSDIMGFTPEQMYSFSHNDLSSGAISEATGTGKGSLKSFLGSNLDGVNLLVIDEIGFFDVDQSLLISEKIKNINKQRAIDNKPRLGVVFLGDPSQITKAVFPYIEERYFMPDLNVVSPLTQSYRTNVPAISGLFRIFQRNPKSIKDLGVSSNVAVGQAYDPNNKTIGVHSGGNSTDVLLQLDYMKGSGRSKVIIVNTEADKAKYIGQDTVDSLISSGDLQVMTYDEVQGQTFEEVYVDINPKGDNLRGTQFSGPMEYNQAMYTALSRAKDYVFVVEPSFTNSVDTKLENTTAQAEQEVAQAFLDATNRASREKELLSKHLFTEDQANRAETVTVTPPKGKETTEPEGGKDTDMDLETTTTENEHESGESSGVVNNQDGEQSLENQEGGDPQATSNVKSTGEKVDTKGNNSIEITNKDGKRVHVLEISNPQYESTRPGYNPNTNVNDGMPPVLEGAPVVVMRMEHNGKEQTVYLGQKHDGKGNFTKQWQLLGVASNEDRNSPVFAENLSEKESQAKFTGSLVKGELSGIGKGPNSQVTFDANGRAIIDTSKPGPIIGQATLKSSKPLSYNYNPKETTFKGFFNKLKVHFKNVFGKFIDLKSMKVEIFDETTIKSVDKPFVKVGVPYLTVKVKDGRGRTNTQYLRLTPRKINYKDFRGSGRFKSIGTLLSALRDLNKEFTGTKLEGVNLGHKGFNSLMRKLRENFKRDDSTGNPVYDHNKYDFEAFRRDAIDNNIPEFQDMRDMTEEQFNMLVKAAKVVIPATYRYIPKPKKYTQEQMDQALIDNPSYATQFYSVKDAGMGKDTDLFVLLQEGELGVKKGKKRAIYHQEPELTAGKGPAQIALNAIARAHTGGDVFPYRVVREYMQDGKKVRTAQAKSLLADKSNYGQFFIELRNAVKSLMKTQGYDQETMNDIYNSNDFDVLKDTFIGLREMEISRDEAEQELAALEREHASEMITFEGLESLFGTEAFDHLGDHKSQNGNYLAMPLNMRPVTDKTGATVVDGINQLGSDLSPENMEKIESLMGSKIESISPTSIQLEFPKAASVKPRKRTEEENRKHAEDILDKVTTYMELGNDPTMSEEDYTRIGELIGEISKEIAEEAERKRLEAEKEAREEAERQAELAHRDLLDKVAYVQAELTALDIKPDDIKVLKDHFDNNELNQYIEEANKIIQKQKDLKALQAKNEAEAAKKKEEEAKNATKVPVGEEINLGDFGKWQQYRQNGETFYEVKKKVRNKMRTLKRTVADFEAARVDFAKTIDRKFDANTHGAIESEKIPLRKAIRMARKYIPGIRTTQKGLLNALRAKFTGEMSQKDVELQFVTREVMKAMQQPGESLLGLYRNGTIYLLKERDAAGNWVVNEEILRHEVFHKIYNEYLSPMERRQLRMSAKREGYNVDKMSNIEFEEALADMYMKYKLKPRRFKGRLANFFRNIARIFGFIDNNKNDLEKLFSAIDEGYFKKGRQLFPEVIARRTKIEINKMFGNVQNLKEMLKEVKTEFMERMTSENYVYTPDDLYGIVRYEVRKKADKFKTANSQANRHLYQALIAKDEAGTITDEELDRLDRLETLMNQAGEKASIYEYLDKQKSFDTIVEWLFPSFDFDLGKDRVGFLEIDEAIYEDLDESVAKIIENFNLNEHILDTDTINQEGKLSTSVKIMLGAIPYTKGGERKIMSGRAAFVKMLDLMESTTFSGEDSWLEQFKEAAFQAAGVKSQEDPNWHNSMVKGLYDRVETLFNSANSTKYLNKDGFLQKYEGDSRFLDDRTFVTTRGIENGMSNEELAKATPQSIMNAAKEGKVMVISKDKIYDALLDQNPNRVVTSNDYVNQVANISGISIEEARALFRKEDNRNTLSEFASHMASLREKNIKIAEVTNKFGRKSIRYFSANEGLSSKTSLRSTVDDRLETALEALIDENNIQDEFKTIKGKRMLHTREKQAYKELMAKLKPTIENLKSGKPADYVKGIREILTFLGMNDLANEPIPMGKDTKQVAKDLKYFFEKHLKELGDAKLSVVDKNYVTGEETLGSDWVRKDLGAILAENGSVFDRLVTLLEFNNEWVRVTSIRDAKGNNIFTKTQSTQADDILNTLARIASSNEYRGGHENGRKKLKLPPHLRTNFFQKNIFTKGINKIYGIVDHDGFKDSKTKQATPYTREDQQTWMSRNINAAFLSAIQGSLKGRIRYDQSIYTTSNRPNIRHVTMDVLGTEQIKQALTSFLEQVAARPYSLVQTKDGGIVGFKADKSVNFEIFKKALVHMYGEDGAKSRMTDINWLRSLSDPKNNFQLMNNMFAVLDEQSRIYAEQLAAMEFEPSANANKGLRKLYEAHPDLFGRNEKGELMDIKDVLFEENEDGDVITKVDGEYALNAEALQPLARAFYMNHYVNSYFVNQLVAGDSNFFKHSLDQVKRMSGVFAPGLKGLVNATLGMKEKFKVAVLKDVSNDAAHVNNFLSRLLTGIPTFSELEARANKLAEQVAAGKSVTEEEQRIIDKFNEITEISKKFGVGGYDYADAQGFMTPERAYDLSKGFGRAYGAGTIFKGAHFENVVRTDNEGNEVVHPFMIKYSSVVISDDLANKYEGLKLLRDYMRDGGIDEAIFESGTKVGKPVNRSKVDTVETGEFTGFHGDSIYDLSNENYRLQSNPDHIAGDHGKGVANPTQLGYFLNVLKELVTDGFDGAEVVYQNVAKLIDSGATEFFDRFYKENGEFNKEGFASFVKDALQGKGNEKMLELVEGGVNYNAPHIVNKVFTQLASKLADATVKLRFPGNKLTLQSAFGVQFTTGRPIEGIDNTKARHLQYYVNDEGHMVAEVIVPSNSVPDSLMKRIKAGEEVYIYADAMGFRIPSTELHSAVALKIVDTYDQRGSSMIIAPKELVPLHGSDFDVDSLFMITREHTNLTEKQQQLLRGSELVKDEFNWENDHPVGYREGSKANYAINRKFAGKMERAITTLSEEISKLKTNVKSITDRVSELTEQEKTNLAALEQELKDKKALLKTIKGVLVQHQKNIILEAFLKAITHPENRARMLSPITMEMFNGETETTSEDGLYAPGSIFRMLQDIKLKYVEKGFEEQAKQVSEIVDLSDPMGNYKVYKSNMEGAALTGVWANDIKSMAYMIEAGGKTKGPNDKKANFIADKLAANGAKIEKLQGKLASSEEKLAKASKASDIKHHDKMVNKYTAEIAALETQNAELSEKLESYRKAAENETESNRPTLSLDKNGEFKNEITLFGMKFNQMSEFMYNTKGEITEQPVWEVMDSLVNAAIDNVKEQILPAINANGVTANAISAMLSLGVPMEGIVLIMNQPAVKKMGAQGQKSKLIAAQREAIRAVLDQRFSGREDIAGTDDLLMQTVGLKGELADVIKTDVLKELIGKEFAMGGNYRYEDMGNNELLTQLAVLDQFERAANIGEDLATLSGALNIVRNAPAFKEDFDGMNDKWDKVMMRDKETGRMTNNPEFSFEIPDLFEKNPHIKVAHKHIVKGLGNLIRRAFQKYRPYFEKQLYTVYNRTGLQLDTSKAKSKVKYVDEFMRFVFSGIPLLQDPNITNAVYSYRDFRRMKNKKTGHQGWTQNTIKKLMKLKKHSAFKDNRFIQSLDIRQNKYTKLRNVRFTAGSNLEYHDILELQDDFAQLAKVSYDSNGNLVYDKDALPSQTLKGASEIQHDLVKFAIINFGMQFGTVNYSQVLPAELIKPYVTQLVDLTAKLQKNHSKLQGIGIPELQETGEENAKVIRRAFEDLVPYFELQMALNYADKLPYISKRNGTKWTNSYEVALKGGETETIERNAGRDKGTGFYYDVQYTGANMSTMPEYMQRTNFNTNSIEVFKKLPLMGSVIDADGNTQDTVMYVRVGYGRGTAAYQLPKEVLNGEFDMRNLTEPRVPTISVEDINTKKVKLPDWFLYQGGTKLGSYSLEGKIIRIADKNDNARLYPKYVKIESVKTTKERTEMGNIVLLSTATVTPVTVEEMTQQYPNAIPLGLRPKRGEYGKLVDKLSETKMGKFFNSNPESPLHSVVDGESTTDVKELLQSIVDYGLPANSYLAEFMLNTYGEILQGTGVTFKKGLRSPSSGKRVGGYMDPNANGDVHIDISAYKGDMERVVLHELAHTLTWTLLRLPASKLSTEQVAARERLNTIFLNFKTKLQKENFAAYKEHDYALSSLDEFVVAMFSEPKFQQLLHSVEVADNVKNRPTFFQKAWNAIMTFLGVNENETGLLADAFASLVTLIDDGSAIHRYNEASRGLAVDVVESKAEDTLNKILDRSDKLSVGLDSEGNQLDFYTMAGLIKRFNRVSDQVTGFMSKLVPTKKEDEGKHWIDVRVDKLYKNKEDDFTIYIDGQHRTREDYKNYLKDMEHKGLAKGNIIHKLFEINFHNKRSGKTKQELRGELANLYATSTIPGAQRLYQWVDKALPGLLSRMGINALNGKVPADKRDKAMAEVKIASETLDYAGTIDTMFQHPDGAFSLADWKTGRSFENEMENELFKYGDTFDFIYNNPKNKAKMQVVFYAFMLKVENPDIQFRDLMTVWAPNEYIAMSPESVSRIDVAPFLDIIEKYYLNEDPDKLQEILAKSPNAFKRNDYNGTSHSMIETVMNGSNKSIEDKLEIIRNRIKWLTTEHLDINQMTKEEKSQLNKLFKQYVKIAHDAGMKVESWDSDITMFDQWASDLFSVNHPATKLLQKEFNKALQNYNKEYLPKWDKFQALLEPVFKEYIRNKGGMWAKTFGSMSFMNIKKKMNRADIHKVYKPLMKKAPVNPKANSQEVWRLITEKDAEWTNGTLSEKQKALLTYVNNEFGSFFGSKGFMNDYAIKNNNRKLSNLDLYNLEKKNSVDLFKYERGFLPIVPPTMGDIVAQHSIFSGERLKYWYRKNLTFFYENQYEGWQDEHQALSVRYLGTHSQRATENHSFNLEVIFDRYMRSMTHKKHMDDVYAFGKSMQSVLRTEKANKMGRLDDFIETMLRLHTKRETQKNLPLSRKGFRGPSKQGRETKLHLGKLLKVAGSYTSGLLLGGNFLGGMLNGIGAGLVAGKRGISTSIAKKLSRKSGIDFDMINFGTRAMAKSVAPTLKGLIQDSMLGNTKKNKVWLMMRNTQYLPNLSAMFSDSREMQTLRNQFATMESAYMFYSLPEEMIAAQNMVATLMSMKFKDPKTGKPMTHITQDGRKVRNMWEAYKVVEKVDSDGVKTHELVYQGPTRGIIKNADGTTSKLEGLADNEISWMKAIQKEMQGAYRDEERTKMHYTYLGAAFMKFKTYLPKLMKNAMQSKHESYELGSYQPMIMADGKPATKDGLPLMEWVEQVQEGRWRVMAKVLGNTVASLSKGAGLGYVPVLGDALGMMQNDNYNWKALSGRDRVGVIEGAITLGLLFMIWIVFGGFDDEEKYGWLASKQGQKVLTVLSGTMSQQYNVAEMAKNVANTTMTPVTQTYKAMHAATTLGISVLQHDILGNENAGMLADESAHKGWTQFIKSLPLLSAYYGLLKDAAGFNLYESQSDHWIKVTK